MFDRPASGNRAILVQVDFGQGGIDERLAEVSLLAQSAGILEQEHRLVVTQPAQVGYQTGDARLNRFAANQLLHLGALQSEAARCLQGAGGATSLMALVQAYDRVGEVETASGLLRSYAALVPARPPFCTTGSQRWLRIGPSRPSGRLRCPSGAG